MPPKKATTPAKATAMSSTMSLKKPVAIKKGGAVVKTSALATKNAGPGEMYAYISNLPFIRIVLQNASKESCNTC